MKNIIAMVLFLALHNVAAQTVNAVESISTKEYLAFPANIQAIYLAGIVDGESFISYGYSMPHHDFYVRCVRTMTLGALAQNVAAWLRANPQHQESMASAVAKTLGVHCKQSRSAP